METLTSHLYVNRDGTLAKQRPAPGIYRLDVESGPRKQNLRAYPHFYAPVLHMADIRNIVAHERTRRASAILRAIESAKEAKTARQVAAARGRLQRQINLSLKLTTVARRLLKLIDPNDPITTFDKLEAKLDKCSNLQIKVSDTQWHLLEVVLTNNFYSRVLLNDPIKGDAEIIAEDCTYPDRFAKIMKVAFHNHRCTA